VWNLDGHLAAGFSLFKPSGVDGACGELPTRGVLRDPGLKLCNPSRFGGWCQWRGLTRYSVVKPGGVWQPENMKVAAMDRPGGRREELGQFLTPTPVAEFMASMFGPLPGTVRLLDAGAGAGSLTAAFVSRCCEERDGVRAIEATLYELDGEILDALAATMQECRHRCAEAGIRFTFTIHPADFIQEMSARLAGDLFGAKPPAFDAAIGNPPYRKISTDSAERRALHEKLSIRTSAGNLKSGSPKTSTT